MEKDARPFDMAEEFNSKTFAFGCVFDKAGNIGKDEVVIDTQVRFKGGEVVVGNFAFGPGQLVQQARLADVRKTDDADVGYHLKFEPDVELFAGQALLESFGAGAVRASEKEVSFASVSALGNQYLFADLSYLPVNAGCEIMNNRSDGDLDGEVFSGRAVVQLMPASLAVLCLKHHFAAKGIERA